MNYIDTFITVADDCPVASGVVPPSRGGKKPLALIQYQMLAADPYTHTQEEVLFESTMQHKGVDLGTAEGKASVRAQFFAKPQACLRASGLPKRYGWGLHFDGEGKAALVAMESAEYQRLAGGQGAAKILKALRSSRAGTSPGR